MTSVLFKPNHHHSFSFITMWLRLNLLKIIYTHYTYFIYIYIVFEHLVIKKNKCQILIMFD